MAATNFSGPVIVGEGISSGVASVWQEVLVTVPANVAVTGVLTLPANSRIVEIVWDVLTAGNAVTSVVGTAGTAAAGTQYSSAVDCKTAGRTRAHTAAQLATMASGIGANTGVYITVTPAGGSNTQGSVRALIHYLPGGENLP